MRGNKFDHIDRITKAKEKQDEEKKDVLASLRTVFAGWSDADLAILFPHLADLLKDKRNTPKDGE